VLVKTLPSPEASDATYQTIDSDCRETHLSMRSGLAFPEMAEVVLISLFRRAGPLPACGGGNQFRGFTRGLNEAHLSAEEKTPDASSRIPIPHELAQRTSCAVSAPRPGTQTTYRLVSSNALRGHSLFRRITSRGFRQGSRGTVVFWESNGLDYNRYGIAVRKAVGNAVRRNLIRRWAREFLRSSEGTLRSGVDMVILVNRNECLGSYSEFTDLLSHVFDMSYLNSRQPDQSSQSSQPDSAAAGRHRDTAD
jgi:ribonuclease P protein component